MAACQSVSLLVVDCFVHATSHKYIRYVCVLFVAASFSCIVLCHLVLFAFFVSDEIKWHRMLLLHRIEIPDFSDIAD